MSIFNKNECQECLEYQDKVDMLTGRNKRLEDALRELKKKYDALQEKDKEEDDSKTESIKQSEVDELFQRIKNSSLDSYNKRYYRSMLMLIKGSYNPSIHKFLRDALT